MANFTVRVELHNASSSDYENLHEKMERAGFERSITTENGTVYHLPDAEYSISSDKSTDEIRDLAHDTAKKVKSNPAILVTKSNGTRRWSGLKEA
ncbi:type V toxin-antitoxin system endoribonuclease antitoxin GhoS [Xenorhabdus sp. Flor]|uniref:type V toxin-antitoxin system endoribonuclease antitoxin GhoS n=1 Tax=Xenorhabdus cabanillasii TaxID=351673 RepID=UPI0019BF36C7|nr:type V toxin-antitoxin system endoribonuclease antitoxin GhoS [Xenorhabdus sp. Flor]MBD2814238.1 type V toxin-antitoxin system endoribonuclease antitoxin GhoS [Xenorhabdus sp. Flor]